MQIISVEFKNFASYGNKVQTVEFDENHSSLFLLTGSNGSGKTTLANVIKFLLYGKVDNVNMGDLPNRINKNLWGKIKVRSRNKLVEIERGIHPNIFTVMIDGKEYDQAGKLNIQDYLDKEIYGINFNVFKNLIILSINDFKSFLTMNPGDKKNIIDKLFGFSIINDMKEELKREKNSILLSIDDYERELRLIVDSISSVNSKINELKKITKEKNTKDLTDVKTKLITLNTNVKKLRDVKATIHKKYTTLNATYEKLKDKKTELKNAERFLTNKIKFLDKKVCPSCESPLDGEFHQHKRETYNEELKELPASLKATEDLVNKSMEALIEIKNKEHSVISKISSIETSMLSLKGEAMKLAKKTDMSSEFKQLEELVHESKDKQEERYKEKHQLENEMAFYKIIEDILGDEGIKHMAVQKILPPLNSNIEDLSKDIHLPYTIRFDDNFNARVISMGMEVNVKTLSTGEKKKADFVVIAALIKLAKLKYPSLNILFLDEIFSSVDADGRYTILNVLSKLIKEININTFVINHSVLPSELFDVQISADKSEGFSKLTINEIK